MRITPEEVRRIAGLAHLEFEGPELERLAGDLDQILSFAASLNELEVEGVEPAVGALAADPAPLRADEVSPSLPAESALANAPDHGRGHFKVPKVIP